MANNNGLPGNPAALFAGSGVQYVPGLGYVGPQPANALGRLGDDASVMMISGPGAMGATDDQRQVAVDPNTGVVQSVKGAGLNLRAALGQPITIGSVTLPLWVWLLIATGAVGAAGYFLLFHKKK